MPHFRERSVQVNIVFSYVWDLLIFQSGALFFIWNRDIVIKHCGFCYSVILGVDIGIVFGIEGKILMLWLNIIDLLTLLLKLIILIW